MRPAPSGCGALADAARVSELDSVVSKQAQQVATLGAALEAEKARKVATPDAVARWVAAWWDAAASSYRATAEKARTNRPVRVLAGDPLEAE